jgi:hypothetical protein
MSPTSGARPSSPASQSPKARKIDAYCRRVLATAARTAIRSASRRRDHRDVGGLVGDCTVDELELQDRLDGRPGGAAARSPARPIRETSQLGSR